jgi:uncharacterized protein
VPLHLRVKVKPNAKASSLEEQPDGSWIAKLRSPPVDGKANTELRELIAAQFGCRITAVTIKSGAGARMKLIRVDAVA